MSHKASPLVYKDDYNKNVLGQGPANPAIAFPENDRLKKIHDKTSKVRKKLKLIDNCISRTDLWKIYKSVQEDYGA